MSNHGKTEIFKKFQIILSQSVFTLLTWMYSIGGYLSGVQNFPRYQANYLLLNVSIFMHRHIIYCNYQIFEILKASGISCILVFLKSKSNLFV